MKLGTLANHERGALQFLAESKFDNRQLLWDMAIAMETAQNHLTRYHTERNALIRKMCSPVDGKPDSYLPEDPEAFRAEMGRLNDIDIVMQFPVLDLEDLNGLDVSTALMMGLRELNVIQNKNSDDNSKETSSEESTGQEAGS